MPLHLIDLYNFKPPADLTVNREESQAIRINAAKTSLVSVLSSSTVSAAFHVLLWPASTLPARICCQHLPEATHGARDLQDDPLATGLTLGNSDYIIMCVVTTCRSSGATPSTRTVLMRLWTFWTSATRLWSAAG